ncbi:flagellar protein FlhE [Scandinavium sp. NPDC088450]|uniref:flagellar protein FlhE n=1 Tax=Scandinavium sp. NPDC088450 TaxID=3364514 RepID=UPI0038516600
MIHRGLLALLFASTTAMAADGSWSSQSFGGTLTLGKQPLRSQPVKVSSPLPQGAVAKRLAWKIHTDRHAPVGFEAKVCHGTRCLKLPGLAGEITLPAGFPANGPFEFEYVIAVRGPVSPALTVTRNAVTVHYRTPSLHAAKG